MTGPDGVVDVVVDVGEPVDEPDDPALERLGLLRAGVLEDSVAYLPRQIEPAALALEAFDDAQRVLVVAKAARPRSRSNSSSASSPAWPNGG